MSIKYSITSIVPFVTTTENHEDVLTKIKFTYLGEHETGVAASVQREIVFELSETITGFRSFSDFTEAEVVQMIENFVEENKVKSAVEHKLEQLTNEPRPASFAFQLAGEAPTEKLDQAPNYVLSANERECIQIFEALKPLVTKPIDSTFVMSIHAQMKKAGRSLEEIKSFVLENAANFPEPGMYLSLSRGEDADETIGAVDESQVPADVALVNPDPNAENYYKV